MASPEACDLGAAPDRRVAANPRNHFAQDSILPVILYCNNKPCEKYYKKWHKSLGSCFLIQELNEDQTRGYLYFATAAHNLYCHSCKNYHWVKPILEWQEGQRNADKFLLGAPDRGVSEQGFYGWMKVADKFKATTSDDKERYPFDYGILAVKIAGIDQATQYAANVRRMFAAPDAHYTFVELAYLCGYPLKVCNRLVQGGRYWMPPVASLAGKEAKGSEDPADRKQEERRTAALYPLPQMHGEMPSCPKQDSHWSKNRLYRHYIDTSGGQSGSPVYSLVKSNGGEQCVAMGIHVGLWKGTGAEETSMGFNVAVRLHGHVLSEMKSWVDNRGNEATGQSNPVQGADTLGCTEDGVLDYERLRQSPTLFGSYKAEPVTGAAAQAHPLPSQERHENPWRSTEYLSNYPLLIKRMVPATVLRHMGILGLIDEDAVEDIDVISKPSAKNVAILRNLSVASERFGKFREILRRYPLCKEIAEEMDLVGPDPKTDPDCKAARDLLASKGQ